MNYGQKISLLLERKSQSKSRLSEINALPFYRRLSFLFTAFRWLVALLPESEAEAKLFALNDQGRQLVSEVLQVRQELQMNKLLRVGHEVWRWNGIRQLPTLAHLKPMRRSRRSFYF